MIQRLADLTNYASQIGLERIFTAIGAALGAAWGFAFGEAVAPLLWWLIVFIVIDTITGWRAAAKAGKFQSRIFAAGVTRKLLIVCICGLAHGLDVIFEPMLGMAIFQSMTFCAYALGEFASILENLDKAGYGSSIPPILRRLIGAVNHRLEDAVDQIEGENHADKK